MSIAVTIATTAVASNSVALSATPSGGTSPYTTYWCKNKRNELVPEISTSIGTGATFTDINVSADTTYYYSAISVDSVGLTAVSAPLQVTTSVNASPSATFDKTKDNQNASDHGVDFQDGNNPFLET